MCFALGLWVGLTFVLWKPNWQPLLFYTASKYGFQGATFEVGKFVFNFHIQSPAIIIHNAFKIPNFIAYNG